MTNPMSQEQTPQHRLDIAPGVVGWIVAANTCDLVPDHIVMLVGNDPMCMAMLRAGHPVVIVEDLLDGAGVDRADA